MSIWNPFQGLLTPKSTSLPAGGGSGTAGSTTSSTTYTMSGQSSSGSVMTGAQIQQILQGFTLGLTAEEQKELDLLQIEHQNELKAAKIAEFKKIPNELRQFIINYFTWQNALEAVDNVPIEKNDRLIELERKNVTLNGSISGQSLTFQGAYPTWTSSISPQSIFQHYPLSGIDEPLKIADMPEGLTIEDLMNAHAEQCLEEEMLDEKSE
jgi:hypothetical protein